jgi:hypothetical protein
MSVARLTLMPDVGLWDTAEAQALRRSWARCTRPFPAYVLLGWLATTVLGPLGRRHS